MEKIERMTPDITQENVERITELFPSVATEIIGEDGTLRRAIDFDALHELLGDVAEGQRERYQLTWPGKREAKLLARIPSDKTMRPMRDRSVNWDTTENLYVEGDNLEALKLMRETYAGKIKLIYIDPPYNTGNNLIYKNDFSHTISDERESSGDYDDAGNRMVSNPTTNGRFHSDWLSMIYPRLLLARDLLNPIDGVLVCAIDENELATLDLLLKEVFGESIYETTIVTVVHNPRGVQGKNFSPTNEYALFVYPKGPKVIKDFRIADEDVSWSQLRNWGSESERSDAKNCFYPVIVDSGGQIIGFGDVLQDHIHPRQTEDLGNGTFAVYPIDRSGVERKWRYARQSVDAIREMLRARKSTTGFEIEIGKTFGVQKTVWTDKRYDANEYGTKIVNSLVPGGGFTFPKSLWTVYDAVYAAAGDDKEAIILDFFSGSGTTAHAVMKMNSEDGGHRKFIMVQVPERIDEKLGSAYSTICEIGEERIRQAGSSILSEIEGRDNQISFDDEVHTSPDIGFRVLRIDSSNFRDTYSAPEHQNQASLYDLIDNLKENRTSEDLLYQVLPTFRIPYSAHIEVFEIDGVKCFNVNDGQLIACFDVEVGTNVIEKIAQERPIYAVFRDASLADDSAAANFEELFKTYSPDTIRRVI